MVLVVGGELTNHAQSVVGNHSFSKQGAQGLTLGSTLLNIFIIHDLDDGIKCTLMKMAHDAKLKGKWTFGRESHSAGVDLDRLEEWTNKNLKYKWTSIRPCTWEKHQAGVQQRLESHQLGKSSVERDLGCNKVDTSEHCAAAAAKQGNRRPGCTTSRDTQVIIPLCSAPARPHLEYCVQFWFLLSKKVVDKLERVQRTATKMIKGLGSCHVKKGWENWACPALRKEDLGLTLSLCSSV